MCPSRCTSRRQQILLVIASVDEYITSGKVTLSPLNTEDAEIKGPPTVCVASCHVASKASRGGVTFAVHGSQVGPKVHVSGGLYRICCPVIGSPSVSSMLIFCSAQKTPWTSSETTARVYLRIAIRRSWGTLTTSQTTAFLSAETRTAVQRSSRNFLLLR